MDLRQYIRDIPDFPQPGMLFREITPLLAEPSAFQCALERIAGHFCQRGVDVIAAATARGFRIAAPLGFLMERPVVPLRKPGKLPDETFTFADEQEDGQDELPIHVDGVKSGDQVLLIDDLLATGGTMQAGSKLIEQAGGQVAGYAFVVELLFLNGRERLLPHEVFSLIKY